VATVLNVLDDNLVYERASTDIAELERFEGVVSLVWRQAAENSALAGDCSVPQ